MLFLQLLTTFAISLVVALSVIPSARRFAIRRGWMDRPDGERKLHAQPIACVGGIAIVIGAAAGLVYLASIFNTLELPSVSLPLGLIAGGAIIFATGIIDDVKGVRARVKLVVQIVAAVLLVSSGFELDLTMLPAFGMPTLARDGIIAVVSVFWVVGVVNATNLVDGLDGLAGGLAMIAFLSMLIIYGAAGQLMAIALSLPLLGALAGVLVVNFNPARIFLGDSGSYFLGYLLAAFSLHIPAHKADPYVGLFAMVAVLGVPVFDTFYSMLRRLVKRQSPFTADHDHIHHRLMTRFSHRTSVLILYAVGAVFGGLGILISVSSRPVAFGLFFLAVAMGVLGFRLVRSAAASYSAVTRGDELGDPAVPKDRPSVVVGSRLDRLHREQAGALSG